MNIEAIRSEFPILKRLIRGKPLVYLDNAATTQKPHCVMDSITNYYCETNANIHRGVYLLSEEATEQYEKARAIVQQFIHAKYARECVFVRSSTEAINLVAHSFGEKFVDAQDEIVITAMEHHANIVPWQMLCKRKGARLKVLPMNTRGEIELETLTKFITPRTKLLSLSHASNALGTLNPIAKIIQIAHQHQVPVLVDGAQTAPHMPIDVQALDCDFFVFSGHKIYGPTGIGVLYGKEKWLDAIPPYQGGGEMITSVTFEKTLYNEIPYKFEAGTPAVAEAIGLGAALNYLTKIGFASISQHEKHLLQYATEALAQIPLLKIIGTAEEKIGVISFIMEGIHPHDIGSMVDQSGIAIRTGHHCAMPVMDFFNIPATARASFGIYNTTAEIDHLVTSLQTVKRLFKR